MCKLCKCFTVFFSKAHLNVNVLHVLLAILFQLDWMLFLSTVLSGFDVVIPLSLSRNSWLWTAVFDNTLSAFLGRCLLDLFSTSSSPWRSLWLFLIAQGSDTFRYPSSAKLGDLVNVYMGTESTRPCWVLSSLRKNGEWSLVVIISASVALVHSSILNTV